jgi:hypothetical protein
MEQAIPLSNHVIGTVRGMIVSCTVDISTNKALTEAFVLIQNNLQ